MPDRSADGDGRAPTALSVAAPRVMFALPVLAVVVTAVVMGPAGYVAQTLDTPGLTTALASGVLRVVAVLAGAASIGGLAHAAFISRAPGRGRFEVVAPEMPLVRSASLTWAVAATLLVAVDAADASGQPLSNLARPGALSYLVSAAYLPRAWIVVAVLAAVVSVLAHLPGGPREERHWPWLAGMLALATTATLPPVLVTQVLVGPNHDFGSDAAAFGTPSATAALGLVLVGLHRHRDGRAEPAEWRRFGTLFAAMLAVTLAADVVIALFETWPFPPANTPTAWLFAVRLVVLGLALPVALRLRRAGVGADDDTSLGAAGPLVALAVLMGVYASAAVSMSRIPPPQYFVPTTIRQNFLGYDVDSAPTASLLALDWRVNLLFLVMALVASGLYVRGVWRLRRRGDRWPLGRTIAWLAGWLVVALTTSSGLGRYSNALLSMHMLFHMSLNMFGPLLLTLGGPVTLALRATRPRPRGAPPGPHEWITSLMDSRFARWMFHPAHAFITFAGTYYVLYFTPLFDHAMRYHWAHQVMNLDFLVIGYIFYSLIIGVDRTPRQIPHIARLGLMLAVMPFHAFFGVVVMTMSTIIAHTYYSYLQVPWGPDLAADQYLAGEIAWATGEAPLAVVVIALLVQWARADARENARTDRHLDLGLDDSFEAYNAMLARINRPSAREHGDRPTSVGRPPSGQSEAAHPRWSESS